jgi:hypothetical protein
LGRILLGLPHVLLAHRPHGLARPRLRGLSGSRKQRIAADVHLSYAATEVVIAHRAAP